MEYFETTNNIVEESKRTIFRNNFKYFKEILMVIKSEMP
jgi:hypothetical protein